MKDRVKLENYRCSMVNSDCTNLLAGRYCIALTPLARKVSGECPFYRSVDETGEKDMLEHHIKPAREVAEEMWQ